MLDPNVNDPNASTVPPVDANIMPLRIKCTLVISNSLNWNHSVRIGYHYGVGTSDRGYFSVNFSEPASGSPRRVCRAGVAFPGGGAGAGTLLVDIGDTNGPPGSTNGPIPIDIDVQWNPLTRRITGNVGTNILNYEVTYDVLQAFKRAFTHFGVSCGGQTSTPGTNQVYAWFDNVQHNLAPALMDGAPTGLTVTGTTSPRLDLTWTDNATGESGYLIARSADGMNYQLVGYAPANATSYSDIDTTLTSLTTYYYRVAAYKENPQEMTAYGEGSGTTGLYANFPAKPKSITIYHRGPNNAHVEWVNAESPGGDVNTGFIIERLVNGTWTLVRENDINSFVWQDNTIGDTVVFPAQYRIAATNEAGVSPYIYSIQTIAPQSLPGYLGVADHYNDWTKAFSQTGWQILPTPAAAAWDYDPGLAERTSDATDAELVYFLPNQQLTTFILKFFYQTANWNAAKLKFYGSPDGVTYTEVPNTVTDLEDKGDGWKSAKALPTGVIPGGYQYVKLVVQSGLGSASAIRLGYLLLDPPDVKEYPNNAGYYQTSGGWSGVQNFANTGYDYRGTQRGAKATRWLTWHTTNGFVKNFFARIVRHTYQGLGGVRDDNNVTFEVSPDNATWTLVPKQFYQERQYNPPSSGGYQVGEWFNAIEIPDGMKYLKLTVRNLTADLYTFNLADIVIGTNGYVVSPKLLSVSNSPPNVVLSWQGLGYAWQWASNLVDSPWTTNVVDGWYDFSTNQPAGQPERYYRLLKR
jgi:hypothetical protein